MTMIRIAIVALCLMAQPVLAQDAEAAKAEASRALTQAAIEKAIKQQWQVVVYPHNGQLVVDCVLIGRVNVK